MAHSGPQNAKVVIIGEAPGEEEDAAGVPFIGRSGRLLTELLTEVGINRDEVYITNAVKCRPVDDGGANKTPTAAQIRECRPYLQAELEPLSPKVIVVLGGVALKGLLGVSGITKARGKILSYNGIPVIATFHPAYAIRDKNQLKHIKTDLIKASAYLREGFVGDVEWEWGTDKEDPHFYNAPLWSFDIETNGKDLNDPELQVLLLGIYDGHEKAVVYGPDKIGLGLSRLAKAAFLTGGPKIVGHNAIGFDDEVLYRKYKSWIPTDDTLILAHQIDENIGSSHSKGSGTLESLGVTWLNVPPWKQQVTWAWSDLRDEDWEKAAYYNAEDCVYTYRLAELLFAKAEAMGVTRGYDLSKAAALVFKHFINPTGIEYDLEESARLKAELTTEALEYEAQFRKLVGENVNLQSPKQVAHALFGILGLDPHHYTTTGQPSTNEEALKNILLDNPTGRGADALHLLLRYRENRKLVEYLESYERLQVEGRLHPDYSFTSTVTYRTSSFDPNVQQWPHDKRVRALLVAKPGNTLTEADYSQMEIRQTAEASGSPTLRKVFADGLDPHQYMAGVITGKPLEQVTENERYVAKPVNFALLYGGEAYTLRKQALLDYGVVLSTQEAQRIHDLYHETYNLEPWYAGIAKELRATGMVKNPLGRIRHLPNFFSTNPKLRLEALRQAINFPIQSFSCDIALIAVIEAIKDGLRVVAFIHDAIYVESPNAQAQAVAEKLREIMVVRVPEILKTKYGVELVVPLAVDIKQKVRQ